MALIRYDRGTRTTPPTGTTTTTTVPRRTGSADTQERRATTPTTTQTTQSALSATRTAQQYGTGGRAPTPGQTYGGMGGPTYTVPGGGTTPTYTGVTGVGGVGGALGGTQGTIIVSQPVPKPSGPSFSENLAKQEFEFQKQQQLLENQMLQQDRAARQRGAQSQADYLRGLLGGGSEKEYDAMRKILDEQQAAGEKQIGEQYQITLNDLNARRDLANTTMQGGFDATATYLRANQPTAFASAERAKAGALEPDTVERYAALVGVDPTAIAQTAVEASTGDQQAVNNYNRLLDFMAVQDAANAESRRVENEMARTIATAQLQTIYSGAASDLEKEKLAALADIYNQIQAQRFGISQAELARKQQLQDALAAILGTGLVDLAEPAVLLPAPVPEVREGPRGGGTSGGTSGGSTGGTTSGGTTSTGSTGGSRSTTTTTPTPARTTTTPQVGTVRTPSGVVYATSPYGAMPVGRAPVGGNAPTPGVTYGNAQGGMVTARPTTTTTTPARTASTPDALERQLAYQRQQAAARPTPAPTPRQALPARNLR